MFPIAFVRSNQNWKIEGKNSVAKKKLRKKRKEITRKRDNGKWEVGNRKREREDCLEHGRRETEEEQRNVNTGQQTNKGTGEQRRDGRT